MNDQSVIIKSDDQSVIIKSNNQSVIIKIYDHSVIKKLDRDERELLYGQFPFNILLLNPYLFYFFL